MRSFSASKGLENNRSASSKRFIKFSLTFLRNKLNVPILQLVSNIAKYHYLLQEVGLYYFF